MDRFIRKGIVEIIADHMPLLRIPIRQKAKFEGWLKFELANYLEEKGMKNVEVESKAFFRRDRTEITFFNDGEPYSIELKTPNTNWKLKGVSESCRPITKNLESIVADAKKLNSNNGIVAFVLFPVPVGDSRWELYLDRISKETGIDVTKDRNCEVVKVGVNDSCACNIVVCTFMSKRFRN